MTTIDIHTDATGRRDLRLTFPGWERLMLFRGDYTVPTTSITGVRVEDGWTSEILGIRSGLVVSGQVKVAKFTHPDGTRRLVAMRRGLPLLRVRLRGEEFDEVLVSTTDAERLGAALQQAPRGAA